MDLHESIIAVAAGSSSVLILYWVFFWSSLTFVTLMVTIVSEDFTLLAITACSLSMWATLELREGAMKRVFSSFSLDIPSLYT